MRTMQVQKVMDSLYPNCTCTINDIIVRTHMDKEVILNALNTEYFLVIRNNENTYYKLSEKGKQYAKLDLT